MRTWKLNLTLFGDGDGAAAASGAEQPGESAAYVPGTVLEDGTRVDDRLAERLNKMASRRSGRTAQNATAAAETKPTAEETPQQNDIDAEWAELKKGKFKDLYGKDVQAAVAERFKNQKDATAELDAANAKLQELQPMLDLLVKREGVKDVGELREKVLNDDSLLEQEAEEAGMTVGAYRTFKELEAKSKADSARLEQSEHELMMRQHIANLSQQAEELKKTFPNFDLREELKNPTFLRLTAPNSGLTVEAAFYAVHHAELAPQAMAAGIRRAQAQISQSIQANRARPVEGAMKSAQSTPNIGTDPRRMTREEREEIKERVRRGEKIILR